MSVSLTVAGLLGCQLIVAGLLGCQLIVIVRKSCVVGPE